MAPVLCSPSRGLYKNVELVRLGKRIALPALRSEHAFIRCPVKKLHGGHDLAQNSSSLKQADVCVHQHIVYAESGCCRHRRGTLASAKIWRTLEKSEQPNMA